VPELLLVIDVGNSRFKFGLFREADCRITGQLPECRQVLACPVTEEVPWKELRGWAAQHGEKLMSGVAAGANPQGLARVVDSWPEDWPEPAVINDPTMLPIETSLIYPRRVGIDRVLNAVAANTLREKDCPTLIVDSGTATTIDRISPEGVFEGGAILPGFELCARALHFYTALLPRISMDELATQPHEPLGRETRAALRSGLFWGQLGSVKELVSRLSNGDDPHSLHPTPSQNSQPSLFLTGGGTSLLAPHFPSARCERYLSLQGLAIASQWLR